MSPCARLGDHTGCGSRPAAGHDGALTGAADAPVCKQDDGCLKTLDGEHPAAARRPARKLREQPSHAARRTLDPGNPSGPASRSALAACHRSIIAPGHMDGRAGARIFARCRSRASTSRALHDDASIGVLAGCRSTGLLKSVSICQKIANASRRFRYERLRTQVRRAERWRQIRRIWQACSLSAGSAVLWGRPSIIRAVIHNAWQVIVRELVPRKAQATADSGTGHALAVPERRWHACRSAG